MDHTELNVRPAFSHEPHYGQPCINLYALYTDNDIIYNNRLYNVKYLATLYGIDMIEEDIKTHTCMRFKNKGAIRKECGFNLKSQLC